MALGCAGMSADDFCRCTPSEFDEVMKAWHAREERRERMGWEQVRTVCLFALQPYSKKPLEAKDIMRFAWDEDETKPQETAEPSSASECLHAGKPVATGAQLRRDESRLYRGDLKDI